MQYEKSKKDHSSILSTSEKLSGRVFTEEHKAKQRKPKSEIGCRNIALARKRFFDNGGQAWNKNLGMGDARIKKSVEVMNFARLSLLKQGKIVTYNKGKTLAQCFGKEKSERIFQKMTQKMCFRPTSYEIELKKHLDKIQPNEWRYTGDGSFWVGYPPMNPDFVNRNGKNVVIEVFAAYYKKKMFGTVEEYMYKRSENFTKYGFRVIYFSDQEYNKENIIRRKLSW